MTDHQNQDEKVVSSIDTEEIRQQVEDAVADEAIKVRGNPRQPTEKELRMAIANHELGDAQMLIRLGCGRFLYDHSTGIYYQFQVHHWNEDSIFNVFSLPDEYQKFLRAEQKRIKAKMRKATYNVATREKDGKYLKSLKERIDALNRLEYRKRVLEFATKGEGSLGISGSEWDLQPHLLGFPNGVLDLRTLEFRPGRPNDYLRQPIPYDWKGIDVQSPVWEGALSGILPVDPLDTTKGGDQEIIRYLQRTIGYSLAGNPKEHILTILIGGGQNGKGTILEVLSRIFGPLAGPVPAEMLLEQSFSRSSSSPSADLMALRGRRLAWASESNEGRKLDSGKVKLLTGGDTISARPPYGKKQISFQPTHQLFLLTNHAPEVDPDDKAMWYRLRLIPFHMSFVESPSAPNERKRDNQLMAKLQAEASGIIAWAIRGYAEYLRVGLNPPTKVLMATQDYRGENDLISLFISECLEADKNAVILGSKLYASYQKWAESSGMKPLPNNKFAARVKTKIGSPTKTSQGNQYQGYRLKAAKVAGTR